MKKFLSLVLALVMTMSLVTVSAGAKDFTDDDKITYDEAVAVVSAIGVVDGYTDGNFNPTNVLTRQAAAKIICNLILGPTTAKALVADTAPYKDVPTTSEFAGYIAYCAQQGIISGYADGTFKPGNTLTGYAFLKMLLGALGYDATVEGYVGDNWSVNVAKQALGIDLTDGLVDDLNGVKAVTREEACLYAFNTLKATMVYYSQKTEVNTGAATVTISGNRYEEEASSKEDTIKDDGKLQFAEKYFPKLTRTGDGTDAFGRPAAEWKYKTETIGTYTDYSDLVATYTAKAKQGDLYSLVGSSVVKKLDAKNDPKDDGYNLTVYVDGEEVDAPKAGDYFVKNSSGKAGVSGNGVLTEVFMDDNNNVTITQINTYLVKATGDYNKTKETLNVTPVVVNKANDKNPAKLPTSISSDDFDVADFKEDDYILVTYSYKEKDIQSVEAAEVVTGEVSEYTVTDYVILDGDKYSYNALVGDDESGIDYTVGEDAVVVVDAYGYVLYVDEAVSNSSYVFIQNTADTTGLKKNAIAAAYFTDGTYDEVYLKKVTENKVSATDIDSLLAAKGNWATYSKSDDKLSLTIATTGSYTNEAADEEVVKNGKVTFMTGVKGNSSTIFLVLDSDDDVTAYTGIANVPTVTASKAKSITVTYVVKNGYAKYVFIDASNDANAQIEDNSSVADYLFILKTTGNKTVSGDNTYYQYKAILDGEETTVYIADDATDNFPKAGDLFYNVKQNSKGYVTNASTFGKKNVQEVTSLAGDVIEHNDGSLIIGADEYVVSGNNVTLVIGKGVTALLKDRNASYEVHDGISASSLASLVKGYDLTGTAYVVVDEADSEVAESIYVYVSDAVKSPSKEEAEAAADKAAVEAAVEDIEAVDTVIGGKAEVLSEAEALETATARIKAATEENVKVVVTEKADSFTAAVNGVAADEEGNGAVEAKDGAITVEVAVTKGDSAKSTELTFTLKALAAE